MNRTAVEEIKARLPIEEVIGSYIKLEKAASNSFKAKCPFHNEKTPSFHVSPDRGGYYCFGCNAKGDIFTFVEQFEGLDFRGALKLLAERAGVSLVPDTKADGERDRLYRIMEDAAAFFEKQYEALTEAQAYVKSRGITDESRKEFRIGWAPEGWSALHTYLKGKGWPDVLMDKAGLAKQGDRGDFYDRFRGRVMFPISDSSGRVIAFSGRILPRLDDGKSAKYINSPDTPLYDKSMVLYGLDKAKSEIRRMGYSILVEGQMDLVMSHQAGVKNAVAASGTALSEDAVNEAGALSNLGLVRRLAPNVIIAFDADAAGKKAALRAAGIALSLGMDVKVADLVGGKDPAELIAHDPEEWKKALRATKQVVEFEIDNVVRDTPDRKKVPRVLLERVFPLMVRIESSTDRSRFVSLINEKTGIPMDAIWEDLKLVEKRLKAAASPAGSGQGSSAAASSISKKPRIDLVERRMFGLLAMMKKAEYPDAAKYADDIRKLAGDSYDARLKALEPELSDVAFEAEAFFGDDQSRWPIHMKDLVLNFEEDMLGDEIVARMQELRIAEKGGDQAKVAELAKKCQELSLRKAEIGRKRRN